MMMPLRSWKSMDNFELIKEKIKLYNVLDEDLDLKKSGRVYKAICPFHDERTPSFVYYPTSDTFHCFGCSIGGTIIDYTMKKESINEPYEVVSFLADKHKLTIKGFDKEAIEHKRETV